MNKHLRDILSRLASGQTIFYAIAKNYKGRMKCTILSIDFKTDWRNILIRCEDDRFVRKKFVADGPETFNSWTGEMECSTKEIEISAVGYEEHRSQECILVDDDETNIIL